MANQLPVFLTGSRCAVVADGEIVAFAQNISMSDDMSVTPVGTLGSYNNLALEPTNYIARGTMTITHYTNLLLSRLQNTEGIQTTTRTGVNNGVTAATETISGGLAPEGLADTAAPTGDDSQVAGNGFFKKSYFSPVNFLIQKTFNIDIYENISDAALDANGNVTKTLGIVQFRLENVRLTNYSIGFSPGQLVNETVSFIATRMIDGQAEPIS